MLGKRSAATIIALGLVVWPLTRATAAEPSSLLECNAGICSYLFVDSI